MESVTIIPGYPYLSKAKGSNFCNIICCLVFAGILYLMFPTIREAFASLEENFASLIKSEPADALDNPQIIPSAIKNAVCHPQCCLQAQWPVEHMQEDPIDMTGYVKTEYSCKGCKNGSGCLCMKTEDYKSIGGSGF
jgi:hypothetical protein